MLATTTVFMMARLKSKSVSPFIDIQADAVKISPDMMSKSVMRPAKMSTDQEEGCIVGNVGATSKAE